MPYIIKRDGQALPGVYRSETDVLGAFHKLTSQSMDWAIQHEGYTVEEVPDETCEGYTNWETFAVEVTLANDEPLYTALRELLARDVNAGDYEIAEVVLRRFVSLRNVTKIAGVPIADVGKVNFREIATMWLDEVKSD